MYNLQDNQPNNLNNKLTNQSKGYQYHQTEYKQENKGMQWGIRFLHGNPTNYEDKKTTRSKTY